jgi:hypothetical protein
MHRRERTMAKRIRMVRTADHGYHFVDEAGRRLERSEVAGNEEYTVVESFQEAGSRGTTKKPVEDPASTKRLVEAYQAYGLTAEEASICAGLEQKIELDTREKQDIFLRDFKF